MLAAHGGATVTSARAAIEAHLGTRQVARVIYGAIIGMALVVVLQDHPPSAGGVVALLVATAVAVGLAELYSEIVGAETRTRRRVSGEHVREILADVLAVGFGIAFPSVFFLLAAFGVLKLDTAFVVAKWSGVGLIGFYGFCAARLAGTSLPWALLQGAAVGAVGAVLIIFKSLVH
jgi:VIT1/CCC1 family predicted Fe2+/Mn2+ transporter